MKRLRLKNFKCFEDQTIPLAPLSVFCGRNGTGKSSAIQGLLLHHAAKECLMRGVRQLSLNAVPGLTLGTLNDIIRKTTRSVTSRRADKIVIEFGARLRRGVTVLETLDIPEEANYVHISSASKGKPKQDPWQFVFLSAERVGPRASQERLSHAADIDLQLGEHGQHLAEVIVRYERKRIRRELIHPTEWEKKNATNELLPRNVELWMSEIFGPLQIRANSNGAYAPPSLQIRDANGEADWVIPTNYGFGVSYCLPIVVACLLMPRDGVIVIDSPEAHLHPTAQTKIGHFLTWVAASGCSVVVETHSDHVVDGIRLGVVDKRNHLSNNDCIFIDFEKDAEGKINVQPIRVNADGSLDRWPRGFFDQQTINLRALAGAKHGKRA